MQLVTSYNPALVLLSLLVAVGAAYVSLGVAEGIVECSGRIRTLSIQAGAGIMGIAIWSMHYVGMLALRLPVVVRYNWPLLVLSIAIAIVASAVAFILTAQHDLSRLRLSLGSLALGGGIVSMHYVGMAAMRMKCFISWNPPIVLLSILIAIGVSTVALDSFRRSSRVRGSSRFLAAALLGGAISSMHWVGMAAAHFVSSSQSPDFTHSLSVSVLGAVAIGVISLTILALAFGGTSIRQYIEKQSATLASSEERYRLLFEKCLLGVYRIDPQGTLLDINAAGVALLGYRSRDELIGTDLIGEHLSGSDDRAFADLVTRHREIPPHEMELIAKDGSRTAVLHSATTFDSTEGPGEIQGFFLSIAKLKWTENELRKARLLAEAGNVAKRQFMTKISHELRTPLNGILGMTGILMTTELNVQQREYLSLLQESGESLLASIDEILLYTNESSVNPQSHWEEFVFRDLVAKELKLVTPKAQRQGLSLHCEIAESCSPRYFSDTFRLRHILRCLLSNAVKFTHTGSVTLSASSRPSLINAYPILTFSVSDTGVGIAPARQQQVFEPFTDPEPTAHRVDGMGLGLSSVKAAVLALHGTISLQSEPGNGSTFTVELPLRPILPLGN